MSTQGRAIQARQIARSLLAAVEEHWAGAPGRPLPERRYIAAGMPSTVAWDCEQLVVALGGIGWGTAQDASTPTVRTGAPAQSMSVRHAVITLSLVRCTPVPDAKGRAPKVAELNAAGEQYFLDAGLLSQSLVRWAAKTKSDIGDTFSAQVQVGTIEPGPASGQYVSLDSSAIVTAMGLEP